MPDSSWPQGYSRRAVAHQTPLSVGILQTRILECVATSFSRGSSQPRDQTQVSLIGGGFLTVWTTREAQSISSAIKKVSKVGFRLSRKEYCDQNTVTNNDICHKSRTWKRWHLYHLFSLHAYIFKLSSNPEHLQEWDSCLDDSDQQMSSLIAQINCFALPVQLSIWILKIALTMESWLRHTILIQKCIRSENVKSPARVGT